MCTFILLSSTYFPHTGAEVDVPPADLAGPWQENAPTSPPPWCSPTTAEDRWGGRGQATHRGCRWSLVVEKRQEKIISGAQLNQQVVKSHFQQSLLMELETERVSGDFLLWLLYGGVHTPQSTVASVWEVEKEVQLHCHWKDAWEPLGPNDRKCRWRCFAVRKTWRHGCSSYKRLQWTLRSLWLSEIFFDCQ